MIQGTVRVIGSHCGARFYANPRGVWLRTLGSWLMANVQGPHCRRVKEKVTPGIRYREEAGRGLTRGWFGEATQIIIDR